MNDSVFGELTKDGNGFALERQFRFFDGFLPVEESEADDDATFRSGVVDELGSDVGDLLDKPLDEIVADELPESVRNSSLGFLLKHGERLQTAMESMLGEDGDEESDDSAELARRAAQGFLPVTIETLGRAEPSDAQRAAYLFLAENEEAVSTTVLNAIFEYYQFVQKEDPNWFADWDCPEIDSVSDLASLIEIAGLVATPFESDGSALVGFQFHCDWDIEQGLGVLVHRDRIIEVGDADSAYEAHSNSVWLRVKPELKEEVASLVAAAAVEKEAAFNELPPSERLTHALLESDAAEIEKLLAEGADINGAEYPAMFVAIDEPNSQLVKKILELGGSTSVEFEGQSAIDYANEMVDSVNQSKKFFMNLGEDLIEELAGQEASFVGDTEQYSEELEAIVELFNNSQA